MSAAFYPVLKDAPDAATAVNGKALSQHIELLDSVALEAGVTPLTQFVAMEGDEYGILEDEDIEVTEGFGAGANWFPADAGLNTVRALLQAVRKQEADEGLLEDLNALEQLLLDASKRGVEWRLAIDL